MDMQRKELLRKIQENIFHPTWWVSKAIPFVYHQAALSINKQLYQWRHTNKWDVLSEDWDTLIIIDGCRADLWEDADMPWESTIKRSSASSTPGFLLKNFSNKDLRDTVYVTANPQINNDKYPISTNFHYIDHVWEWGWDDTLKTVHPETITEAVLRAHEEYPNKRIVAHFVQPHHPFIGKKGREITRQQGDLSGWEKSRRLVREDDPVDDETSNIWNLLHSGTVEEEAVWEAYRENLELTIPYLKEIIRRIDGNVAISSDHGNLLGERIFPIPTRAYGHPVGLMVPNLVEVPWVLIPGNSRRRVEAGDRNASTVSGNVESRLSDLGYK